MSDRLDDLDLYRLASKAIVAAGGQSRWAAQIGLSPQFVSEPAKQNAAKCAIPRHLATSQHTGWAGVLN